MAGLGQEVIQSLGRVDPSMFVNSEAIRPVVTPSAVAALSDAFRKGQVSADDVIERYGELAKTKKKAEIEGLHEFISPESIEARRQAVATAQAQSALAGQQATAAQPLVQPSADVAKTNLELQQAQQKYGTGIQAFQQLAPLTSGFDGQFPSKPDGSPDFDVMGVEGNHLQSIYNQRLIGMERLKPVKEVDTKPDAQGRVHRITFNAFGEDVSPSPNNSTYQMYSRMANQPLEFKFWKQQPPGTAATAPQAVQQPVKASPEVPESEDVQKARARLTGVVPNDELNAMTPGQVMQRFNQQPAAKPEVTVGAPATTDQEPYALGSGAPIGPGYVPAVGEMEALGKVKQQVSASQEMLSRIQEARNIVHNTKLSPVGPGIGEGSKVNQSLTHIKALFGGDASKYAAQRQLDQFVAQSIQNTIRSLAGTGNRVMQSEINPDTGLFRVAAPKLSDTVDTWDKWFKHNEDVFQRAIEDAKSILPPEQRATIPNNPPVGSSAAAPAAGSSTGPVITLPSGKKMQFINGAYQYVQ